MKHVLLYPLLTLALLAAPASGQDDRTFSITPAAAEGKDAADPLALRFTLVEQTPGDGTAAYFTAFAQLNAEEWPDAAMRVESAAELDTPEVRQALVTFADARSSIEIAATRTRASFEFPLREQGFLTLLPHLNDARLSTNLLATSAKLNLLDGDVDAMLEDVRLMLKLAEDVSTHDQPVLIEGLVGVGIYASGQDVLREAHDFNGVPNLYWPLMTAPKLDNFAQQMEVERLGIYSTFPALQQPDRFDAEAFARLISLVTVVDPEPDAATPVQQLADGAGQTAAAMLMLAEARPYLTNNGYFTAKELDSMGQFPTIAHYMARSYDDAFAQLTKFAVLPLPEATYAAADFEINLRNGTWGKTFVSVIMPSLSRPRESYGKLHRKHAALIIVEALRDHAAKHGTLPATLDAVELYLPPDPFTNEPFEYTLDGDTATLLGVAYAKPDTAMKWTITLRAAS